MPIIFVHEISIILSEIPDKNLIFIFMEVQIMNDYFSVFV